MEKGGLAYLAGAGPVVSAAILLSLSIAACSTLKDSGTGGHGVTTQGKSIAGFMTVFSEDYPCAHDAFTSFTGLPGTPLPQEDRSVEEPISVCDGCEDVFLIKSDHIWGENVAQCASLYCPAFGHDEDHFWFYIAFASEVGSVTTYHNAMLCGYYNWLYDESDWHLVAADETEDAVLHRDGDDVVWSRYFSGANKGLRNSIEESCGSDVVDVTTPSEAGATTFRVSGTLPCLEDARYAEMKQDVWEFMATPGETITITIDTPSAETKFHPEGVLVGPESCDLGVLPDSVECSASIDVDVGCPSTTFVAEVASYQLIVRTGLMMNGDECISETAEYSIYLDALTEPGLSLVFDDIPDGEPSLHPFFFSLSGFARITR